MNIPDWATHTVSFNMGRLRKIVAIKAGKYQYIDDGYGVSEECHTHHWGVSDWREALADGSYGCKIVEVNFSLENE